MECYSKGMSIAQTRPDAVVLAADTLVALENQIIGKPTDLSEAASMLSEPRADELMRFVLLWQFINRHREDRRFFTTSRAFVFAV